MRSVRHSKMWFRLVGRPLSKHPHDAPPDIDEVWVYTRNSPLDFAVFQDGALTSLGVLQAVRDFFVARSSLWDLPYAEGHREGQTSRDTSSCGG